MKHIYRVAIRGFTAFERATFESFFRLSTRRSPAYQYSAQLRDSEFVIADADDTSAVGEVDAAGRLGQTVAIGARAPQGVAMSLARPINLMAVVKALDQMPQLASSDATTAAPTAASRTAPVPAPVPAPATPLRAAESTAVFTNASLRFDTPAAPAQPAARSNVMQDHALLDIGVAAGVPRLGELASARPAGNEAPAPTHAQITARVAAPVAAPVAAERPREPARDSAAPATLDHILVVDDSDIALRFMAGQLQRYGFEVHLSRSGEEALERTQQQDFAFVFLDVNMPGLDGFQTCKAIKRRPYPVGVEPPTVVMLTSRDTQVDKLRGTMAGCDAYLTKPLGEAALLKVIGDREVRQHEYAETARASDAF